MMRKLLLTLILLLVIVIVGGGVYLASWDMPAPVTTMEIDVPSARLSQ